MNLIEEINRLSRLDGEAGLYTVRWCGGRANYAVYRGTISEIHAEAWFTHKDAAELYCALRNALVTLYGDDRIPSDP